MDGEPIRSELYRLLTDTDWTKASFYADFEDIHQQVNVLDDAVLFLSERGRTMTRNRKQDMVTALTTLIDGELLDALDTAYVNCGGQADELPVSSFAASMSALIEHIQGMEDRTVPFHGLYASGAKGYLEVLTRFIGEKATPRSIYTALEELTQTEAYALAAALNADPEAGRKREAITRGSYEENMAFLAGVTRELYDLDGGFVLPIPYMDAAAEGMELAELGYRLYPGLAFLKAYGDRLPEPDRERWNQASYGYLAGIAVHASYEVNLNLPEFELNYLQYRWYEDMLDVTMTGLSAFLIHYYGYTKADLAAYLKEWGAEDHTEYLYGKAMDDPFESLAASYGYYCYLDICQAALDAGCESEDRFLRDYLAAGPMPFPELKEYMVRLYQNQG